MSRAEVPRLVGGRRIEKEVRVVLSYHIAGLFLLIRAGVPRTIRTVAVREPGVRIGHVFRFWPESVVRARAAGLCNAAVFLVQNPMALFVVIEADTLRARKIAMARTQFIRVFRGSQHRVQSIRGGTPIERKRGVG